MSYLWKGFGQRSVAATTSKGTIDLTSGGTVDDYAYHCSVVNTGTADIAFMLGAKDDTDADFTISEGVVIRPEETYSWSDSRDQTQNRRIYKLFHASIGSGSTFNVSFS